MAISVGRHVPRVAHLEPSVAIGIAISGNQWRMACFVKIVLDGMDQCCSRGALN